MLRTELIEPVDRLLARHAQLRPDVVAFADERGAVGYQALDRRTARLAGHLVDLGVGAGDRVATYIGNGVAAVESQLAAVRAGAIAVPINPLAPAEEVRFMLEDVGARVLCTDRDHADAIRGVRAALPALERMICSSPSAPAEDDCLWHEQLAEERPGAAPRDDPDIGRAAWMVYTSGTTGRPKGVLLSQRGCLWVAAAAFAPALGLGPEERLLSPLPLFHSYAIVLTILSALATATPARIMARFSAREVLALLAHEPITVLAGVPTMFHYLLAEARQASLRPRALRLCMSAGAIMPAALNREFEQLFGMPLLDGYGITETSTMVTMNWPTGARPPGSCGLPLPGSSVRIVDPASGEDVPAGRDGELLVRGPHVMLGYYNRPEATENALAGGWYHTGDLGHCDENGFIQITGRIKELIIRGGENVYPAEVESALAEHPMVADSGVVGAPDEALGEVVVAFVVPSVPEAFEPAEIVRFLGGRLAPFKIPAEIRTIDAIPRTGSGKTLRHKLAELLPERPA